MAKAKSLLRFFMLAFVLLAFPAGYIVVQAADGGAAVKAFLADPQSFLAGRSPGMRGAVPFPTTKPAYAKLQPPAKPDPGITPPDSEAFLEPPVGIPGVPLNNSPFPDDQFGFGPGGPFAPPAVPAAFGPEGIFPGPDGFFFDPDGTIAPPLPPFITDPPVTPSGVPEPDTWLMMLVGFLATGAILRRRNRTIYSKA